MHTLERFANSDDPMDRPKDARPRARKWKAVFTDGPYTETKELIGSLLGAQPPQPADRG